MGEGFGEVGMELFIKDYQLTLSMIGPLDVFFLSYSNTKPFLKPFSSIKNVYKVNFNIPIDNIWT